MKKFLRLVALSILGIAIAQPTLAETVELSGGRASINCNKLYTGTYNAPWSFESFNGSPIFYIRVKAFHDGQRNARDARTYSFFTLPSFEYEDDRYVFTSAQPIPIVEIAGEVLTPFGSISTRGRNVGAICPFPLNPPPPPPPPPPCSGSGC